MQQTDYFTVSKVQQILMCDDSTQTDDRESVEKRAGKMTKMTKQEDDNGFKIFFYETSVG